MGDKPEEPSRTRCATAESATESAAAKDASRDMLDAECFTCDQAQHVAPKPTAAAAIPAIAPTASDNLQHALSFIASQPDPRELVTLAEMLRLGRADYLYVGADGVLVRTTGSGMYFLAAQDVSAAERIGSMPLLVGGTTLHDAARLSRDERPILMTHDARQARALGFPVSRGSCYNICLYEGEHPLPLAGTLDIRQLGPGDLAVVAAHYDMLPEEDIARHLADGWVWGGYNAQGDLVGFIGEHDESAIGMLEVFPEHRRHGYATELEAHAVNRMLAAGRAPFGQVVIDNAASFALQESLGMTRLPGVQCWTE